MSDPQKIYLEPLLSLPTAYRINRHASDWHTRPYAMEPKVIVTNCYTIREEGMASHPSILACRRPVDRGAVGYSPWGGKESDRTKRLSTVHTVCASYKIIMTTYHIINEVRSMIHQSADSTTTL